MHCQGVVERRGPDSKFVVLMYFLLDVALVWDLEEAPSHALCVVLKGAEALPRPQQRKESIVRLAGVLHYLPIYQCLGVRQFSRSSRSIDCHGM